MITYGIYLVPKNSIYKPLFFLESGKVLSKKEIVREIRRYMEDTNQDISGSEFAINNCTSDGFSGFIKIGEVFL